MDVVDEGEEREDCAGFFFFYHLFYLIHFLWNSPFLSHSLVRTSSKDQGPLKLNNMEIMNNNSIIYGWSKAARRLSSFKFTYLITWKEEHARSFGALFSLFRSDFGWLAFRSIQMSVTPLKSKILRKFHIYSMRDLWLKSVCFTHFCLFITLLNFLFFHITFYFESDQVDTWRDYNPLGFDLLHWKNSFEGCCWCDNEILLLLLVCFFYWILVVIVFYSMLWCFGITRKTH